jgi:hypothetical protein
MPCDRSWTIRLPAWSGGLHPLLNPAEPFLQSTDGVEALPEALVLGVEFIQRLGMAVPLVSRVVPGLIVQDRPLTYVPDYGPSLDFHLEIRLRPTLHGPPRSYSADQWLPPYLFRQLLSGIYAANRRSANPLLPQEGHRSAG